MNLRQGLRSLRRTPVFALTVILILALGIGAATTMFSIVHGVLLAPLPYQDPDRLVSIGWETPQQQWQGQPPALRELYQRSARRLEAVGFHRGGDGKSNVWDENSNAPAEGLSVSWVGAGTLPLLGVAPLLGRVFNEDEYHRNGPGAVILSEAEWRARFNAAPDALGKTLMVNSVRREIVGVMPAGFAFPRADTRMWLPGRFDEAAGVGEFVYAGVARLAPGATPAQAQQELAALLPNLATEFPRLQTGGSTRDWLDTMQFRPVVTPLREHLTTGVAPTLWLLAAAAGLVLLVAWANVANLMLIRADTRRAELAVRRALGARGLRAVAHALTESLLLSAAAAALALLLSWAGVRLFVALSPAGLPRVSELGLGWNSLGVAVLLAVIGALVCALLPLLQMRSQSGLGQARRSGTAGPRLQAAVVAAQFAVALAITAGSALLLRSAQGLYDIDPGFKADRVTTLWTGLPFAKYDDARSVAFYSALSARVRELPSVEAAGLATRLPLARGEPLQQTLRVERDGRVLTLPINIVDDDYFSALRIPVLAGRGFVRSEHEHAANIVLSQGAATLLFGGSDGSAALGERLRLEPTGPVYTVVGVVGDVRDRALATAPVATLYRPPLAPMDAALEPGAPRSMALLVRSKDAGSTAELIAAIGKIAHELDPTVPVSRADSLQGIVDASIAELVLMLQLLSGAALITLLLGNLGLYGAMAYMVTLRGREFGIRVALGAGPGHIIRLVASRGVGLAVVGMLAGLGLYALLAPYLRNLLYGVESYDPPTLITATLILSLTAAAASWLPARDAARTAPMVALKRD